MTGAEVLLEALAREGVEVIFGHPGGAIMPVYDALYRRTDLRHVLTRHEQGAGHAAEGYARRTGRVGVALATSGPGALNLVTPLADAMMDSTPLVAITGQVPTTAVGTDAFQEADVTGVTMPVTKHNYLITDVNDIPRVVKEAFHIARTGRPGPVLIDLPKDVQNDEFTGSFPEDVDLPGYKPASRGHPRQIQKALEALAAAERPVLMVGGGAQHAAESLRRFVATTGIPVVATLLGLGVIAAEDPRFVGMPGMHGSVAANRALQHANVILAIGQRFDDRVTGDIARFAPQAHTIIHVNIEAAEIGKVVPTAIPVVGDAAWVAERLAAGARPLDLGPWWEMLRGWMLAHPFQVPEDGALRSQAVIRAFYEATGGEAVVVTGVGQHQMFAAQFFPIKQPRSFLTSGGLGTMGFGLPAAIGAQVADPEARVLLFDGDGSFQMTLQELATVKKYRLPLKMIVLNNGHLGMVRQWQDLFYDDRYSEVYLADSNPDFAKIAEAYGIEGVVVEDPAELGAAVERVLAAPGPVLAEFRVVPEEAVFPMIPAGGSAEDILIDGSEVAE